MGAAGAYATPPSTVLGLLGCGGVGQSFGAVRRSFGVEPCDTAQKETQPVGARESRKLSFGALRSLSARYPLGYITR